MTSPADQNLASLLDALRDAESGTTAPAHVEAALMHAWDASHTPAANGRLTASVWFGSLAAAAVLAVGLTTVGGRLRSAAIVAPSSLAAETSPTVVLVGEPLLDGEQIRIVRMRMPATALHALGIRSTAASLDDVDVDVVVGEDGVARALSLNP